MRETILCRVRYLHANSMPDPRFQLLDARIIITHKLFSRLFPFHPSTVAVYDPLSLVSFLPASLPACIINNS